MAHDVGSIQLSLRHPRGDNGQRYAASALAEEFLNENRNYIGG